MSAPDAPDASAAPGAPGGGATFHAVAMDDALDVVVLDQRLLPEEEVYVTARTVTDVAAAIRDMLVRGAPAIGITAAYGMVVASRGAPAGPGPFLDAMRAAGAELARARPTAVNLAWAVSVMLREAEAVAGLGASARVDALAAAARRIHEDDVAACRAMGALGARDVPAGATIVAHCNAGALATGGYGTSLGVVRAAHEAGKRVKVLACETRPYLQGARLTAWELAKDGIPVEVITDSMAGWFMKRGAIDLAIVGADRIARNGDVANKIGTYGLACLARAHDLPFYVAAPWSTVDLACATGADIPIEERPAHEITHFALGAAARGAPVRVVPAGVGARNPSFDVTDARLVTAIFTERGKLVAPYALDAGIALR